MKASLRLLHSGVPPRSVTSAAWRRVMPFRSVRLPAPQTTTTTTLSLRSVYTSSPSRLSLQKAASLSVLSGVRHKTVSHGFLRSSPVTQVGTSASLAFYSTQRHFHHCSRPSLAPKSSEGNQLQGVHNIQQYRGEEEEEQKGGGGEEEDPFAGNSGPGYLPFPPPFHTINIVMVLFILNVLCYFLMKFGNDDIRDFMVEHFTLSHENCHRIYPLFTNAIYQENLLQLAIDCWLLWQFGDTMLGFLGNARMTFFFLLCTLGGSMIHLARQKFELYYGKDELEVRGRCYGPNPFILGLISVEGLIFRHLNIVQQPPVPFLVLTAFLMVIDVWRIFTTRSEEHGASTGGALIAYVFWALPTRMMGLDKLTAAM